MWSQMQGKNNLLFTLLQSLYWSSICLSSTFLTLYLESQGYNKEQTGILYAYGCLFLLVGQYFWGAVCHKYPWLAHKQIIAFSIICAIGFNLLFPIYASQFIVILVLWCIFNFTIYSVAPLIDAWTMAKKMDSPEINYGLTRGIGSGVYAIVAISFGVILSYTGLSNIFIYSLGFVVAALLVTLVIGPARIPHEEHTSTKSGLKLTLVLMKNSRFVILLLTLLFTFTASNANFSFYGLLITQLGGSSTEFGIGMFISAMGEFIIMLFFAQLSKKFSFRTLLICSYIGLIAKSVGFALSGNLQLAVAVQSLNSISFGLFLPACIAYIGQIVKKSELTLAIMIFASMSWGIAGFTGNYLGGWISENYGIQQMYWTDTMLAVLGLLVFCTTFWIERFVHVDSPKKSMI